MQKPTQHQHRRIDSVGGAAVRFRPFDCRRKCKFYTYLYTEKSSSEVLKFEKAESQLCSTLLVGILVEYPTNYFSIELPTFIRLNKESAVLIQFRWNLDRHSIHTDNLNSL